MSAPTHTYADDDGSVTGRRHEILGIIAGALTLLSGLSMASYHAGDSANWIGAVGVGVASTLIGAFGLAAWVVPVEMALATARLFQRTTTRLGGATAASALVVGFVSAALMQLTFAGTEVYGGNLPGGVIGEAMGEVMRSVLGTVGAYLVGISILLVTAALRSPIPLTVMAKTVHRWATWAVLQGYEGVKALYLAWREAKHIEAVHEATLEAEARANGPKIIPASGVTIDEEDASLPEVLDTVPGALEAHGDDDEEDYEEGEDEAAYADDEEVSDEELEALADGDDEEEEEEAPPPLPKSRKQKEVEGPRIIPPSAKAMGKATAKVPPAVKATPGPFMLPPTTLLQKPSTEELRIDPKVLRENAALLVKKLEAYGVRGRVDEIHPGPVVTMYEFEPESGTKLSKIAALADDLAMALAAQKVRIVAPIPGKARVGFELPNEKRKTVYMREILEDTRWNDHDAALPMALGQNIAGQPVYVDMASMPHLLVAGATGSGKSVGLNVMLTSLLARRTPEEVRFLMIDPKVVELAVFDGIPHMLLPVVTDMRKAALALRWAVDEMERRYHLFADAGARSVASYNKKVAAVLDGTLAPEKLCPSRIGKVRAQGANGEEVLLNPADGEEPNAVETNPAKLPHIVVVVDEFADLMMVAAKDVESAIARLAQKARAAGIHVILATQRPSVDVITGMIKANFPARMAFKVSQREDSKTILGRNGAEHLLGMGDMLLIPPGSSDLMRIHSAYVSEDDVKSVCDYLRLQGAPVYDEQILKPREDMESEGMGGSGEGASNSDDPLYDRAVAIVAQAGYCSISHLQRQLSLGYNKAAKLVERMEKDGVVGPPSAKAGGRREVLIQQLT